MSRGSTAKLLLTVFRGSGGPVNTVAPSHDGTAPVIGTEINGTAGTWSGSPTLTYQWYRNATESTSGGSAIGSATSIDYTPVDADFGYYLYVAEIPNGVTAAQVYSNVSGFCQIAGLSLWLDASDATTLFQASDGTTPATADNDVVGYWGDKSGNGRNAIQATTANKPLLKLAIKNGLNVVRFDGTDDLLNTALALPNAVSAFVVYANKASGNRAVFSTDAAADSPLQRPIGGTETRIWPHQSPLFMTIATGYAASAILWLRWNYTTDVYSVGLNTTAVADTVVRSNPGGNIQLGGANATPIDIFGGDLCEVIVSNEILSDTVRDSVLTYLNAKWAVY